MKKLLAVVLALIMLMSVSAVAFAADEPIVLHVAQDFDPGSLAPYGTRAREMFRRI